MGGFTPRRRAQIEDLFAILRIQQGDTALRRSILHGNPTFGKARQTGYGARRQQAQRVNILGVRFGGDTGLGHQLQVALAGMMQTVDAQPHRRLLVIGVDQLFPLRRVSLLNAFQQPARVQIAAVVIGGTLQQLFLLALELAQYAIDQPFSCGRFSATAPSTVSASTACGGIRVYSSWYSPTISK